MSEPSSKIIVVHGELDCWVACSVLRMVIFIDGEFLSPVSQSGPTEPRSRRRWRQSEFPCSASPAFGLTSGFQAGETISLASPRQGENLSHASCFRGK